MKKQKEYVGRDVDVNNFTLHITADGKFYIKDFNGTLRKANIVQDTTYVYLSHNHCFYKLWLEKGLIRWDQIDKIPENAI